jgi:hypothetical protein
MPSSGIRRVALVRTDVSEEHIASIMRVKLISELLLMKNAVVWDVTPCGSCKNRRFGRTYRLHHEGEINQRATADEERRRLECHAVWLL